MYAVNLIYANIHPGRLKVLHLEGHQAVTDSPYSCLSYDLVGPTLSLVKKLETAFRNEGERIIIRRVAHSRLALLTLLSFRTLHARRRFRKNYARPWRWSRREARMDLAINARANGIVDSDRQRLRGVEYMFVLILRPN